ncbi:MAG: glucose-1-phosphate cytidylyltransferase [Candidatus Ryanbacteria bacterium RIFCSPHIGHO2_02_FULL_45_43]|uniref:Glucose-1-phosphate cytidylyltransferase n=1 Tax=Candidatus Ryanbacteria bacterium RIFCSPHIGHO2_01_45_13 TaxID=1802112 RepID=A0A1G2FYI7_9BACT|nr:MAG: glucose-1-phosphate cytidylyltransferase [Candidatus Ryanbacteria bacterium RIFCSPHIGHO2_01_FULL_44_130]OGZ42680.1 MAG: glucose-1-phosphate cytidylyltransferase [Candidatus Ryanbacteria bacterium RIFCSPHIGHO2_01_45_13]OGZ48857.1 MAG: glucose-1-phosphate cytidylyltransferase [Candidatus Ryanbacteria bacterium RIFCSPHIGHO2_02_FULL_45_43]OGZ50889.1 MAG: glucose-1-phosphate cytidylyltransferase [Candidatus Ryanbacteria bacterium RIFCSPHIGHO2_12_FULL_44_20]OGZ52120.1 MAG: glucose-1-phosphate
MKVVILCGGRGARLSEETEVQPKPLVRIGERPILWHIMKLYSHYRYNDFILCIGYKGEMIKNYFLNYDEMHHDFTLKLGSGEKQIHHYGKNTPKWNITFVDTGGPEAETGSRIARVRPYLEDDEEFFLTYGDGVTNININKLYEYHKEKRKVATVTGIKRADRFGVLEVDDGLANKFAEKPQMAGMTNGGFFVLNKKIFDYLSEQTTCVFEKEPLLNLVKDKQLAVYYHDDFWQCVDTQKDLMGLNSLYRKGHTPWMVWDN